MAQNLSEVMIPFPQRLMSTARAPARMQTDFAREIRNMYALQDGAGTKRNGFTAVGNPIGGEEIVKLMSYLTTAGVLQKLAVTNAGKIYLYNTSTENWDEKYSGLNTSGSVRDAYFAGKLILCNGMDDMLSWEGSTFQPIEQLVADKGANLTFINDTQFSIETDASYYPVGSAVQARLGAGVYVASTVSSVAGTTPMTVTLADAVLTSALDEVSFTMKPPPFAFIYPAHDRLWGFGRGPLQGNTFSNNPERSRVFYTAGFNDETAWYDEDALPQYINLGDKMPAADELTAMAVKDGLTVFFGRNYSQIWSGDDPSVSGNFSWVKTLPIGVVHGDLVVNLPNDVGFFTRFGARTLSRTLQTEQLDVGDFGAEVDPTLAQAVNTMLGDDALYRKAQAFRYDPQGWFGFKAMEDALVFQTGGSGVGWTLFDGFFKNANAFLNPPDGTLYAAIGGQLYQYDESTWGDAGTDITTRWWTPWLNIGSGFKRWASKFYELVTEQGAGVKILLKRYKNYNSASFVQTEVTANQAADYWETTDWDEGYWDNGNPTPERERDRFVADVFAYAIESSSTDGPLTIFGLKLQGVREK